MQYLLRVPARPELAGSRGARLLALHLLHLLGEDLLGFIHILQILRRGSSRVLAHGLAGTVFIFFLLGVAGSLFVGEDVGRGPLREPLLLYGWVRGSLLQDSIVNRRLSHLCVIHHTCHEGELALTEFVLFEIRAGF